MAAAGDVNGDGYADFAAWWSGGIRLWYGSATGPAAVPDLVVVPTFGGLAATLSGVGDVNGDGYADILVGSPIVALPPFGGPGFVAVYHGGPLGPSTSNAVIPVPQATGASWGRVFSGVGDLDGDGYSDIAIGARGWSSGPSPLVGQGAVFVYPGSANGIVTSGARVIQYTGTEADENLGEFVAAAGRIDAAPEYAMLPWDTNPLPETGIVLPYLDTLAPTSLGSVVGNGWFVSGLLADTEYRWKIRILSRSPYFPRSPWFDAPTLLASLGTVRTAPDVATSVPTVARTGALRIESIHPNPFNPRTEVSLRAAPNADVKLRVFDLRGREVRTLNARTDESGVARIVFDGADHRGRTLASGVYLLRGSSEGAVDVGRMTLLR